MIYISVGEDSFDGAKDIKVLGQGMELVDIFAAVDSQFSVTEDDEGLIGQMSNVLWEMNFFTNTRTDKMLPVLLHAGSIFKYQNFTFPVFGGVIRNNPVKGALWLLEASIWC